MRRSTSFPREFGSPHNVPLKSEEFRFPVTSSAGSIINQQKSKSRRATRDDVSSPRYLNDYRSFIEEKDQDENSGSRSVSEKESKFVQHMKKSLPTFPFESSKVSSQQTTSSPALLPAAVTRYDSVGGGIVKQSKWRFDISSPIGRSGSLQSLRCDSQDGQLIGKSDPKLKNASKFSVHSAGGSSKRRLSSLGLTSVELKTELKLKNGQIQERRFCEASIQTEITGNCVQDSCAQTDDVIDDVSIADSDVSQEALSRDRSYEFENHNGDIQHKENIEYYDRNGEATQESGDEGGWFEGEPTQVDRFLPFDNDFAGKGHVPDKINRYNNSGSSRLRMKGADATVNELDSGIENTISSELNSLWKRWKYAEHGEVQSSHSTQRSEHRSILSPITSNAVQVKDPKRQTTEIQPTLVSNRYRIKPEQIKMCEAVPLKNWFLLRPSGEDELFLEPWTALGMDGKKRGAEGRDFATQTFGQTMDIVRATNATQTDAQEWQTFEPTELKKHNVDEGRDGLSSGNDQPRLPQKPRELLETTSTGSGQADGENEGVDRNNKGRKINRKGKDHSMKFERNRYDDDLTDEIIQVFRDTRKLIAEAKVGKTEVEMSSGKRELLEIMLREVRSLKNRWRQDNGVAKDSKENASVVRRKGTGKQYAETKTGIDFSDGEEEKRYSRRRLELLYKYPPNRNYGTRTELGQKENDSSRRRWMRQHKPHHSRRHNDNQRLGTGLEQSASQYLERRYSQGPVSWNPPPQNRSIIQSQSSHFRGQDTNYHLGDVPLSGLTRDAGRGAPPIPSAPHLQSTTTYFQQPLTHQPFPGFTQSLPTQERPPTGIWGNTGSLGQAGAFRTAHPTTSTQKQSVIFVPTIHNGRNLYQETFPYQVKPSIFLPTYVPVQVPSQPSLKVQPSVIVPMGQVGHSVSNRQEQVRQMPSSRPQQGLFRPYSGEPQGLRKSSRRTWKASTSSEFERSMAQAALQAEQIKVISQRLLKTADHAIAI